MGDDTFAITDAMIALAVMELDDRLPNYEFSREEKEKAVRAIFAVALSASQNEQIKSLAVALSTS